MTAIDATFPLHPALCIVGAMMLFAVLSINCLYRRWNLGVTFLSFWVLVENVMFATNGILWYDNADIKLYVYCDICMYAVPSKILQR